MQNLFITPRFNIVNRDQRRKFENCAIKVVDKLGKVEHDFLTAIFDEKYDSYSHLYEHFLDIWKANVLYCTIAGRTKFCVIHEDYFANNFAPEV